MTEWVCQRCGSTEVYEAEKMTNPNNWEPLLMEVFATWCDDCQAPTNIIAREKGDEG